MSRAEYWTLNLASLMLAAVIVFEMYSSDQLEIAQDRARKAQLPLLQDQEIQPFARQLVQRVAQGAAVDPALKDLLNKYGFRITIRPAPPDHPFPTLNPPPPAHP